MDSTKRLSKKIALLGSHAVGKTSLISRFVHEKFPEDYLTTIGLKVDKKSIEVDGFGLDMVIWDIAGQDNVSQVPHYYLKGCDGLIYVGDLSRPATYENIGTQLQEMRSILGEVEIVLAANKKDLLSEEELAATLEDWDVKPDIVTSAKFDDNVEDMFFLLGKKLL